MQNTLRTFGYKILRLYWRWRKPVVLGSRALVIQNEEVLLVRLSYVAGWYLPGGGVERKESFKTAIVRELKEECGITAHEPQLFGLYHSAKTGKIDHVAIYIVKNFSSAPDASSDPEILEVKFFNLKSLPDKTTPATRRRVDEYLAGKQNSEEW